MCLGLSFVIAVSQLLTCCRLLKWYEKHVYRTVTLSRLLTTIISHHSLLCCEPRPVSQQDALKEFMVALCDGDIDSPHTIRWYIGFAINCNVGFDQHNACFRWCTDQLAPLLCLFYLDRQMLHSYLELNTYVVLRK